VTRAMVFAIQSYVVRVADLSAEDRVGLAATK
jgi:hypothetical protein